MLGAAAAAALIDEAQAEAETIKDAIKVAIGTQEAVQAGEYRISWKSVTTARLDAAALKRPCRMWQSDLRRKPQFAAFAWHEKEGKA